MSEYYIEEIKKQIEAEVEEEPEPVVPPQQIDSNPNQQNTQPN